MLGWHGTGAGRKRWGWGAILRKRSLFVAVISQLERSRSGSVAVTVVDDPRG